MLTKTEKSFILVFIFILIAELICVSNQNLYAFHYFTKPALLVSLIIFFWKNSSHLKGKTRSITFAALSLSLFGDMLLMFVGKSQHFFIGGLVSFLLAHIMYIFVFLDNKNQSKKATLFIIIMLIYGAGFFYVLRNNLGDMLLPILVYMIAILTMSTSAFLRKGNVPKLSYLFVFLGAIFFMISDSLLALNKFHQPLPFSNISIMFTYGLAQLFIVLGIKKQS